MWPAIERDSRRRASLLRKSRLSRQQNAEIFSQKIVKRRTLFSLARQNAVVLGLGWTCFLFRDGGAVGRFRFDFWSAQEAVENSGACPRPQITRRPPSSIYWLRACLDSSAATFLAHRADAKVGGDRRGRRRARPRRPFTVADVARDHCARQAVGLRRAHSRRPH